MAEPHLGCWQYPGNALSSLLSWHGLRSIHSSCCLQPSQLIPGILSPLSCTSLWEPPGKSSFGAEENPSRSSQPLVFSSQNQPMGATVGMQGVPVPGVLVCRVSLGLSLAWWKCPVCWDVPLDCPWHGGGVLCAGISPEPGTAGWALLLLWWALVSPGLPCILQEYIPELQLERLCLRRVSLDRWNVWELCALGHQLLQSPRMSPEG